MRFLFFKILLLFFCLFLVVVGIFAGEKIFEINYKNIKADNALKWLKDNKYGFQTNVENMNPSFENGKLFFRPKDSEISYLIFRTELKNAKTVKIYWGVSDFHEKEDYDKGIFRETLSVTISFGLENQPSGRFFIPDAPYFLNVIYAKNADPQKMYTTKYYKKGGRTICPSCLKLPIGLKEALTEVDVNKKFKQAFPGIPYPGISSFTIGSDLRDSTRKYEYFIKKIEVFD